MRKLLIGGLVFALSVGVVVAAEVTFVKFDAAKKELTVKEGDKDAVYTVTDDTKVKRGDKEAKPGAALKYFGEKAKEGDKVDVTVDKEKKTVTEIKLKGKNK